MSLNKTLSPLISRRNLIPNLIGIGCIGGIVHQILERKNRTNQEKMVIAKEKFLKCILALELNNITLEENILNSVVAILNNDKIIGSGIFISENTILTAKHVMDGERKNISAMDINGNIYTCNNQFTDSDNDLGILQTNQYGKGYMDIYDYKGNEDDIRLTLGFGGGYAHPTLGRVMKLNSEDRKRMRIKSETQEKTSTNSIIKGDSGSAVFNGKGKLVGITIQGFGIGFNSYCIYEPIEDIRDFLHSV